MAQDSCVDSGFRPRPLSILACSPTCILALSPNLFYDCRSLLPPASLGPSQTLQAQPLTSGSPSAQQVAKILTWEPTDAC